MGGRDNRAVIAVGKVGGLFGSDGGLSLTLFDDFPTDFNIEEPVFVTIDEHAVPLFFDEFRRRGQRGATVRFADIDTEPRALELVGLELRMPLAGEPGGAGSFGEPGYAEDFLGWVADLREAAGEGGYGCERGEGRDESEEREGREGREGRGVSGRCREGSDGSNGREEREGVEEREECEECEEREGGDGSGEREGRGVSGRCREGEIVGFVDGANPLFEVAIAGGENGNGCGLARNGSGRTVYIPAVEEFIVELDEPRRRIIFELPEGLLDLND